MENNQSIRSTKLHKNSWSAVLKAQNVVSEILKKGDTAIDATAGNGKDTVFLAQTVGPQGRVFAFDIQEEALIEARHHLLQKNCEHQVFLICSGHEKMTDHIPKIAKGKIRAVMFNLGYRPTGDKSITTRAETTITAIDAAIELIHPDGVITVVYYTGHPGGREEADRVKIHLHELSESGIITFSQHTSPEQEKKLSPGLFRIITG